MLKERMKIDGHWYWNAEWYPSQKEARAEAARLRKTDQFKGVRVVRQMVNQWCARYWIYTR